MTTSPCCICFNILTEEDELVLYKTLQADWDVLPKITGNILSFCGIRVYEMVSNRAVERKENC